MTQAQPLPAGALPQFFRGFSYPLRGLRCIRENGFWGLSAAPIAVNLVVLGITIAGGLYLVSPVLAAATAWLLGLAPDPGFLHTMLGLLGWLMVLAAWVLVIALAAVFVMLVGQAVASPFLDLLSERVERIHLGTVDQPLTLKRLLSTLMVALHDLFGGLAIFILFSIPIFLVGLTGVGAIPAAIASYTLSALLFAHEFIGLALVRQQVGYRGRWSVVRRNFWVALGFGAACFAMFFVPGVNLVLMPLAAAGGTLLYGDLKAGGRI